MSAVHIASKDGLVWQVVRDQSVGLLISRERIVVPFPEGLAMSPIGNARLRLYPPAALGALKGGTQ